MSNPTVQIAARSVNGIVQPVQATPDGALRVTTGFAVPLYDNFDIVNFAGNNNTNYTEYTLNNVSVARIYVKYVGGTPTTNNAQMSGSYLKLPPYA